MVLSRKAKEAREDMCILPFLTGCFFQAILVIVAVLTLPKRQISDPSKLKEYADDNFKFDENDGKSPKWIENTVGKREIARYEQLLLFPQSFQKNCTADT